MKLLIASRNSDKVREIREIFTLPTIELVCAADIPGLPDVIEDSDSIHGNAVKKAVSLALFARMWTLADDSGLEVDALGGAPGACSARYAGEYGNYAANNMKLLREMEGKSIRAACFRCVVALSSPSGRAQTVEGVCEGVIAAEPSGRGGFGYDPVFIPRGYTKTFAELEMPMKNRISHRGRALRLAMERWGDTMRHSPRDWPPR